MSSVIVPLPGIMLSILLTCYIMNIQNIFLLSSTKIRDGSYECQNASLWMVENYVLKYVSDIECVTILLCIYVF